jgi:ribose-phosphate pyrophosphokinase
MRLILHMPGNEGFAQRLAAAAGGELGAIEFHTYPGGESAVRLLTEPKGRRVDIVCTLPRANEAFLPLIFVADACRDLGALEVNLIAPYLAYMRHDKRFRDGEAITSRTFARLISSSFDRLITVDPHLHRYHALSEIYSIPALALSAAPVMAEWIAGHVSEPLIVGPDSESEQWAAQIGLAARAPHIALAKTRHGDLDVRITAPDLSHYRGRRPVLIDDIASSGRTLVAAAQALMAQGFARPVCVVVHGIFAGDALDALAPVTDRVVSTDSVDHPTNQISLARLVAGAIAG